MDEPASEHDKVFGWRRDELERAGYDRQASELLAGRADVDIHRAAKLLADGCPQQNALEILL